MIHHATIVAFGGKFIIGSCSSSFCPCCCSSSFLTDSCCCYCCCGCCSFVFVLDRRVLLLVLALEVVLANGINTMPNGKGCISCWISNVAGILSNTERNLYHLTDIDVYWTSMIMGRNLSVSSIPGGVAAIIETTGLFPLLSNLFIYLKWIMNYWIITIAHIKNISSDWRTSIINWTNPWYNHCCT